MEVNSTSNIGAIKLREEWEGNWSTASIGAEKVMHPDIVAKEIKLPRIGATEGDRPGEKRRIVRERRSEHADQPTEEDATKKEEIIDEHLDNEQAVTEAQGSDTSSVHSLQCLNFHITCCTVHRKVHRWVPTDHNACCTGRPEYASNISKTVCPEILYSYSAWVCKT